MGASISFSVDKRWKCFFGFSFLTLWLLYCKTTQESVLGLGKFQNKASAMGSGNYFGPNRWMGAPESSLEQFLK